jgi:uncharacterized membrane protein YccF (DUF307 family)
MRSTDRSPFFPATSSFRVSQHDLSNKSLQGFGTQSTVWHLARVTFAVGNSQPPATRNTPLGPLGLIGNLIWLLFAGWWLALAHIITAIVLAVTIVGIPFAWAHVKLAGIAALAYRQGDRSRIVYLLGNLHSYV